ncbi:hypothetical protein Sjap_013360 [Stephania japonica]|uniref:Uncharacterized protein n=1 Tax=Stephania japonica TaxID=461633 RepID=A0AAP0NYJ2_9MAGN
MRMKRCTTGGTNLDIFVILLRSSSICGLPSQPNTGGSHFRWSSISVYDTIDMATLKAMKYHYSCERQKWIREDGILDCQYCSGYESPPPTNSPVAYIDAPNYLEYSYTFSQGDDGNDDDDNDGNDGDDEAHQEFMAPPQKSQHPTMQPLPPSTFGGFTPPLEMSPSSAYISVQLGYMHEYMTQTFTTFETRLRRIEA